MVLDADYEALDYRQLVELELAFDWANGIIKSLLPIKKQKEIDDINSNYLVKHGGVEIRACASTAESKESIKEDAVKSTNTKKVAAQEHPLSIEECPDTVKRVIEMAASTPVADGIIVTHRNRSVDNIKN